MSSRYHPPRGWKSVRKFHRTLHLGTGRVSGSSTGPCANTELQNVGSRGTTRQTRVVECHTGTVRCRKRFFPTCVRSPTGRVRNTHSRFFPTGDEPSGLGCRPPEVGRGGEQVRRILFRRSVSEVCSTFLRKVSDCEYDKNFTGEAIGQMDTSSRTKVKVTGRC